MEVRKAIATAAEAGLGIVSMKTIGVWGPEWQEHLAPLGRRRPYLADQGVDARAAMKLVLQDPNVHTIIAGITTFHQLEVDLKLQRDFSLSGSEKGMPPVSRSPIEFLLPGMWNLHQYLRETVADSRLYESLHV